MNEVDTNRDNSISLEEFMNGMTAFLKKDVRKKARNF
jgi:hypothetical protein